MSAARIGGLQSIVALIAPIAAAALYWQIGTPGRSIAASRVAQDANQPSREQIDAMIAKVKQRLEKDPDNVEGWTILARTHYTIGNFQDAAAAYAALSSLCPTTPTCSPITPTRLR